MPQAGLHAAFGNQFRLFLSHERRLFPAIIFGAILPDLDVIAVAIGSLFYPIHQAEHIFHRTFSHSFFTLILIYLLFAIWSELKNNPSLKSVGKGLVLGMLTHIVLDTFFGFEKFTSSGPYQLNHSIYGYSGLRLIGSIEACWYWNSSFSGGMPGFSSKSICKLQIDYHGSFHI